MRVALMSDIHGFDLAFAAVLAEIDRSGPFDLIVVAGDLCELGPRPEEVIRLMRERHITAVRGNTDVYLIDGARTNTADPELRYAIDRIGPAGIAYLDSLPFELRVSPPGGRGRNDDLLVVHANPRNLMDPLDPTFSDDELADLLGRVDAAVIAFGHVHICYLREVGSHLLMNVAAVGNSKNGDLSSKWGIATWDEARLRWSAELRTVPYPIEETEAEIIECGVPSAKKVIRKLKRAAYRDR